MALRLRVDSFEIGGIKMQLRRDQLQTRKRRLGHTFPPMRAGLRENVDKFVRQYTPQRASEQEVGMREIPAGHG